MEFQDFNLDEDIMDCASGRHDTRNYLLSLKQVRTLQRNSSCLYAQY
jgi:hypothetical protein